MEKYKKEIYDTEIAFAKLAAEKGVAHAFAEFAAEDGVLNRNDSIVKGKSAIMEYNSKSTLTEVQLKWEPDFVDVSESGDLGYTYGKYTFSRKDKEGKLVESEGIFHTVWKRQSDGTWKYVWD